MMKTLPVTPEIEAQIQSCVPMAHAMTAETCRLYPGVDPDELLSDCLRSLWLSAAAWRPDGGTKFSSFACNRLKLVCRSAGRRIHRRRLGQPLETCLSVSTGERPQIDRMAGQEEAGRALDGLSAEGRFVIESRADGATRPAIGQALGISEWGVLRLEQRAMDAMRETLQEVA
jgi:RNA polymerase sigma factor (sigma-70 family)